MIRTHKKRSPAMRRRIFAYLALFCAFTIAILWVFQILFFDSFYQTVMLHKMENAQAAVSRAWKENSDDSFRTRVFDVSEATGFCISVYRIDGNTGDRIVKAHEHPFCLIHNIQDQSQLSGFYNAAGTEEGSVLFRFDEGTFAPEEDGRLIVSVCLTSSDGGEIMTLVNCDILPVDSTVSTILIQFAALTVILLVASAFLAVIISRHLSGPVSRINDEAKRLATGDYSVHFDASGCREMVELSDTLNYTASELGRVDRMQKELLANISHDLRTPLTMISGYAEVMRDIPGEMTAENMQIVIDETARLTSLVNDVLDLSRITSGNVQLRPKRFSLTALVSETMRRYSRLREREGYEISFSADRECFVTADETRISQVLYNLVNNAISYTGEDRRVLVEQNIRGGSVRISVTDTGEGIPKEKLPLIWERYYKASEYHRRGAVGSGLGLSIVKGILDQMGAAYGVSSTPGEGSTFWFELPLLPDGDAAQGGEEAHDDFTERPGGEL